MALDSTTQAADVRPPRTPRYRGLADVARDFPPGRRGRPLHPATLTRWIIDGVRARDGGRIRLRAKRLGSRWLTTDEDVAEFLDRVTVDRAGDDTGPGGADSTTPTASRREAERADRVDGELDAAGFGDRPRVRNRSAVPLSIRPPAARLKAAERVDRELDTLGL